METEALVAMETLAGFNISCSIVIFNMFSSVIKLFHLIATSISMILMPTQLYNSISGYNTPRIEELLEEYQNGKWT